jgi:hypothetical protein
MSGHSPYTLNRVSRAFQQLQCCHLPNTDPQDEVQEVRKLIMTIERFEKKRGFGITCICYLKVDRVAGYAYYKFEFLSNVKPQVDIYISLNR